MTSTTLMTFILQTPPTAASVDLLGSWDNFRKPYPMQKDLRTGRGHWRGCHTFEDIICDGELNNNPQKRNGGLKMGGKYWYFYQLNGDIEYHNPAEPSTTSCPLLPGQPVNVLDVPIQMGEEKDRARSGSTASATPATCTMNPEDKYLNPRPAPQPEPPRHTASQTSLRKLADQSSAPVSRRSSWSSKSRTGPSYPGRSVKFNKLLTYARKGSAGRVSRSLSPKRTFVPRTALRRSTAPQLADTWSDPERGRRGGSSVNGTLEIGEPTLLSRTDGSRHCIPLHNTQSEFPLRLSSLSTSPILEPRLVPFELAEKLPVIGQGNLSLQPRAQPDPSSRDSSTGRGALCHPELAPGPIEYTSQRSIYELDAESPACQTRLGTLSAGESYLTYLQSPVELPLVVTPGDVSESQPFETVSDTALPQEAANPDPEYSDRLEPLAVSKKAERPQLLRSHFSAWSTSTITPEPPSIDNPADLTSPSLSSATDTTCDPLSPYRLSFQFDASANNELAADVTKTHYTNDPDTHLSNQSADDFEDLSLDSLHISPFDSKRFFDPSSFQSYSLPQEEQASSVHTPHKLPTSPFSGALPEPAIESRHGADLVRSWNDGSAHRLTATEELLNDLGYLGGMIVPN